MKIIFIAFRPSTKSVVRGEIPADIGPDQMNWNQWIGEQYNWQFIPMEYLQTI